MPKESSLLRIAHRPAVSVPPDATARDAAQRMVAERVGAAAVVDGAKLVGIVTERDLLTKVIDKGLDPSAETVSSIMAADPMTFPEDGDRQSAVELMLEKHFRHLPLVDKSGELLGILSIRHLLRRQLQQLQGEVESLEAYLGADGPGG